MQQAMHALEALEQYLASANAYQKASTKAGAIHILPGPVFLWSESVSARRTCTTHQHRWNQFVYATAGTLLVMVEDTQYLITPQQAIWLPTGVPHRMGTLHGAQFRNLYIADVPDLAMPSTCTVLSMSPLLRALIVELERVDWQHEDTRYRDQVDSLILEQLRRLDIQNFHLPWPRSPMLLKICEMLYAHPADNRNVDEWGAKLGASARTLTRHFEKEVGVSLRAWRHRMRVFRALEWLGAGRSVTDIALSLGYRSSSAFTYMFRQEMGCSPMQWGKGYTTT
ncbi:Transcriptional regulator, AraC family [Pseudomonas chlororaphis]|uniref:Transcriptional regulator, AraC family n=2 Tax=Pseudomonas chlororaphis TaxID=587753 RepID=A0A3G7THK9_9PSED|nr:Transcriptional regulator, AraC family [Pseudomonas chlororaphis]